MLRQVYTHRILLVGSVADGIYCLYRWKLSLVKKKPKNTKKTDKVGKRVGYPKQPPGKLAMQSQINEHAPLGSSPVQQVGMVEMIFTMPFPSYCELLVGSCSNSPPCCPVADTSGSGRSTLISCRHSTGWRLSFSRRLQSRQGKAGAGLHVAGPRHHQGATDCSSSNYWKYVQLGLNVLK